MRPGFRRAGIRKASESRCKTGIRKAVDATGVPQAAGVGPAPPRSRASSSHHGAWPRLRKNETAKQLSAWNRAHGMKKACYKRGFRAMWLLRYKPSSLSKSGGTRYDGWRHPFRSTGTLTTTAWTDRAHSSAQVARSVHAVDASRQSPCGLVGADARNA